MKTALKLLTGTAPMQLHGRIRRLSPHERIQLRIDLEAIVLKSSMYASYVEQRGGNLQHTDSGHVAASKAANVRLVRTRKMLGFSLPDSGTILF